MFYQLPPAGNPILTRPGTGSARAFGDYVSPYRYRLYQSGTASLAAALLAAKSIKTVSHPEVILPAYGCPDLLSAAVFAGVRPKLVDFAPERPWMDTGSLTDNISQHTIAVVAVNFLGIPERTGRLREIASQENILLIEDSAQAFPVSAPGSGWAGDLVVLSFGRGKPVSLLGGGAVLFEREDLAAHLPAPAAADKQVSAGGRGILLKSALYNLMIDPRLYWLPDTLPFLHLGQTRYHALSGILAMDSTRQQLLPVNVENYQARTLDIQQSIRDMIEQWVSEKPGGVIDLPGACHLDSAQACLRYPVLVNADRRERLLKRLGREGLGGSMMYPSPLPDIAGVKSVFQDENSYPHAREFSRRIVTLPTHSQVRARDIEAMRTVFEDELID